MKAIVSPTLRRIAMTETNCNDDLVELEPWGFLV